jgi:hypothetical protein
MEGDELCLVQSVVVYFELWFFLKVVSKSMVVVRFVCFIVSALI